MPRFRPVMNDQADPPYRFVLNAIFLVPMIVGVCIGQGATTCRAGDPDAWPFTVTADEIVEAIGSIPTSAARSIRSTKATTTPRSSHPGLCADPEVEVSAASARPACADR